MNYNNQNKENIDNKSLLKKERADNGNTGYPRYRQNPKGTATIEGLDRLQEALTQKAGDTNCKNINDRSANNLIDPKGN